jgi:hypothetical protein
MALPRCRELRYGELLWRQGEIVDGLEVKKG